MDKELIERLDTLYRERDTISDEIDGLLKRGPFGPDYYKAQARLRFIDSLLEELELEYARDYYGANPVH